MARSRRPAVFRRALLVVTVALCRAAPALADDQSITQAQPTDGHAQDALRMVDAHIVDGGIGEITLARPRREGINLHGAFLLPGLIDAHPRIEDRASAKRALLRV